MTTNETGLIIRRAQPTNDWPSAGRRAFRYPPCILSVALATLFSVGAWSQTQLAAVSGTITDPSGAVVPGVSVSMSTKAPG